MYCKKCGKRLPDGLQFCIHCGTPVNAKAQSAQEDNNNKETEDAAKNIEILEKEEEPRKIEDNESTEAPDLIGDVEDSEVSSNVSSPGRPDVEAAKPLEPETPEIEKTIEKPAKVEREVLEEQEIISNNKIGSTESDYLEDDASASKQIKKKDNKKSILLVASIVVGIGVLAVAGYFVSNRIKSNNLEKAREEFVQNMPPLTDELFEKIGGRYTQSDGGYIEIISPTEMRMTTSANSSSEPISMTIHGYKNSDDGYYIYADSLGQNVTYAYRKNGESEYLYAGYDSNWNQDSEGMKTGKVFYAKEKKVEEDVNESTSVSDANNVGDEAAEDLPQDDNKSDGTESQQDEVETFNVNSNVVWSAIQGHYEDGNGDTVDVDSVNGTITRFILGGNQSHTFVENIHSFLGVGDCYLIKVEMDGERYTYLYATDNGSECLYLGTEDGWNPSLNPYNYVSIQIYVKTKNEANTNGLSSNNSNDYILYDSDKKYYDRATIEKMTAEELRLARNEIYARHGRMFKADDLQNYFNSKSWYRPLYSADEFDAMGRSVFNDCENANLDLIIEVEKTKR